MRKPTAIVLSVIGLAALLLFLRLTLFAPAHNDQKEIAQALQDSIQAGREGRPGVVMDFLSDKFKINGQTPSRNQVEKFVRNNKPDIEVFNNNAVVSGDTARIDTSVHVKFHILTQEFDQKVDNVTLVFQKEDGHKFIFIPDTEWHLVQVQAPTNIPIDVGGDGGLAGMFGD